MAAPQSRTPRKRARPDRKLGLLLLLLFAVIALIVVAPKAPTRKALNIDAQGKPVSEHAGLKISEIMASNASALPDDSGDFPDWLELWNTTDQEMNLEGVSLSNRPDKTKFIFPATMLPADGRVIVFCDDTNANTGGKPFHAKFKISSIKAAVYLFDTSGFVIDSVQVPTLNANEVYALQADGTFQISEQFSPGFANDEKGHQAYLNNFNIPADALVISEVMAAPRSGLKDEDGEYSDWVELHNRGSQAIDLSGLALSDNETRPVKWIFPQGAQIAPGGYYLVFCSGKDRQNPGGYPHTNFSLRAEGETITLSTRQGRIIDRAVYANLPADCSWGRNESGAWQVYTIGTPGAPNTPAGMQLADKYLRSLNHSGVYISEVMSSNANVTWTDKQKPSDWVEVVNTSAQAQDLSQWGLSDSINWPRKWQFPQGTYIQPGEYKTVLLDKSKSPGSNAAALHASFALARAGGEVMTLSDAQGNVLDRMMLPEIPTNISYGRSADMSGFVYFDAPTPGAANAGGFVGFAKRPALSHPGGLYAQNISISMQGPEGAQVRYTLDGSIPTLENSQPYSQPLEIKDTAVIRVRAFIPGLQPSETVTATYVMKTYFTLPVVCLVTDPKELWDPKEGMYAAGNDEFGNPIDLTQYKGIPFKNPVPTYRLKGKIQRPGYVEMFDSATGKVYFSQGMTFGLIGQYSLDMPQKSFKVTARAQFGEKYFNAKLFEDRPFEQFKSFVLRVSGNDQVWTRMVDGVQSRLVDKIEDTTVLHQAWRPVIVYLNGKYWGHYNLRERVSRYFVAQHEGLSLEEADSVTILEANGKAFYGNASEYSAFIKKVKTLSPGSNPEDLKYILENIDIDNYFDYMIFEMFFGNTDTGNIRYYKLPSGKWRWILYDLDYGLFSGDTNGFSVLLNPKGTGVGNKINNTLIRKILENSEMQDKFLRRFGTIYKQLTTEVMLGQIDEVYNLIKPEMLLHFERWASLNLKNIDVDQPKTPAGALKYWNQRVDRLKNVVRKRPTYIWDYAKEWFHLTDEQTAGYFGPRPGFPPETVFSDKEKKLFNIK